MIENVAGVGQPVLRFAFGVEHPIERHLLRPERCSGRNEREQGRGQLARRTILIHRRQNSMFSPTRSIRGFRTVIAFPSDGPNVLV